MLSHAKSPLINKKRFRYAGITCTKSMPEFGHAKMQISQVILRSLLNFRSLKYGDRKSSLAKYQAAGKMGSSSFLVAKLC